MSLVITSTPKATNTNQRSTAVSRLRAYLSRPKVVYTNEFPYSRKKEPKDHLPEWQYNREKFPQFQPDFLYQQSAYIIQDKKTGTVYNWFSKNYMDGDKKYATEKEHKILDTKVMPLIKSNEKNLDFRVIGWDWQFCRDCWTGVDNFVQLGDQFIKFFDEDGIEYYYDECVYEHDWDEDDKEALKEDYSRKTYEYWDEWNYTNENLGVKP